MTPLERLAGVLREQGGLIEATVTDPDPSAPSALSALADHGPRGPELAFAVEATHEGYLLHHGGARVVLTSDEDLALLAGDHLYALGLERLAALGELDAIATLAGVIAACSRAHAEGRPQDAGELWRRGAEAVGQAGARQVRHVGPEAPKI